MELVGDGHVPHDRVADVLREQCRVGLRERPKHAGKMAVNFGQAPFLEEDLGEALCGDDMLEEVVNLPVAVDVERPK